MDVVWHVELIDYPDLGGKIVYHDSLWATEAEADARAAELEHVSPGFSTDVTRRVIGQTDDGGE